jgi:uncharacterized protein (TIGR03083 family)
MSDLPAELAGLDPIALLDRETARVDEFYSGLSREDWSAPTRCADWNRKELLAHLATIEDYTRAGLADATGELLEEAGGGDFNAWGVAQRAGLTAPGLLAEWRELAKQTHSRLRERGTDGLIDTAVGPYPVARQAFYLASEYAIHADDAGVPVTDDEREARLEWRVRFARVALAEADHGVVLDLADCGQVVRLGENEAFLDDGTFVEAASGRLVPGFCLPDGRPMPAPLQSALVVLA